MKILFITGKLGAVPGASTRLVVSLAEQIAERCECHVLGYDDAAAKSRINGVDYHCVEVPAAQHEFISLVNETFGDASSTISKVLRLAARPLKTLRALRSLITRIQPFAYYYRKAYRRLEREYKFDFVIASYFPMFIIEFVSATKFKSPFALYQLDPYGMHSIESIACERNKTRELRAFKRAESIFTSYELADIYGRESGYKEYNHKYIPLRFPCLSDTRRYEEKGLKLGSGVSFCYAGAIGDIYRRSDFFIETFDILLRDMSSGRLTVITGSADEKLALYAKNNPGKLTLIGSQPADVALGTLSKADFVINIGNDMHPQQLPSKTISCISTGRPIINFYYTDDCPTLEFMGKYPYALCVDARSGAAEAARRIADFCAEYRGKRLDYETIARLFGDCTPEYAAKKMIEAVAAAGGAGSSSVL